MTNVPEWDYFSNLGVWISSFHTHREAEISSRMKRTSKCITTLHSLQFLLFKQHIFPKLRKYIDFWFKKHQPKTTIAMNGWNPKSWRFGIQYVPFRTSEFQFPAVMYPRKTNECPLKRGQFKRKVCLSLPTLPFFRGHLSFRGNNFSYQIMQLCNTTLPHHWHPGPRRLQVLTQLGPPGVAVRHPERPGIRCAPLPAWCWRLVEQ